MSDGFHHRRDSREQLTARQREVLELISRGHTNPDIAARLGISLEGAKHHVSEILSRLDVRSREEAAAWWLAQRPSALTRITRVLWPWPALATGAAVAAVVALALILPSPDPEAEPTPQPALRRCNSGALDYQVVGPETDGNIYFTVVATSPDAPCLAEGDVNLVPVAARVNEPPNVENGIRRNFPPQVKVEIPQGGGRVLVLRWSNWCGPKQPIVWRPMATAVTRGFSSAAIAPFVYGAMPECADGTEPSLLERIDSPAPVSSGVRPASSCRAEDIQLALYEEDGWRPQEPALLEVRASADACDMHGPLTATLYLDARLVGTASIEIDAALEPVGFRLPFRWSGPCLAEEVRLDVVLGQATAAFQPTARPHCTGAAREHGFRAGW